MISNKTGDYYHIEIPENFSPLMQGMVEPVVASMDEFSQDTSRKPLFFSIQKARPDSSPFRYFDQYFEAFIRLRKSIKALNGSEDRITFIANRNCTNSVFEIFLIASAKYITNPNIEIGLHIGNEDQIPLLGTLEQSNYRFLKTKNYQNFFPYYHKEKISLDFFDVFKCQPLLGLSTQDAIDFCYKNFMNLDSDDLVDNAFEWMNITHRKSRTIKNEREINIEKFWATFWQLAKQLEKDQENFDTSSLIIKTAKKNFLEITELRNQPHIWNKVEPDYQPVQGKKVLICCYDAKRFKNFIVHLIKSGYLVTLKLENPKRALADLDSILNESKKSGVFEKLSKNLVWYIDSIDSMSSQLDANLLDEFDSVFDFQEEDIVTGYFGGQRINLVRLGQYRTASIAWETFEDNINVGLLEDKSINFGEIVQSDTIDGTSVVLSVWIKSLMLEEILLLSITLNENIYQVINRLGEIGFQFLADEAEWERFFRSRFALWPIRDTYNHFFKVHGPSQKVWELVSLRSAIKLTKSLPLPEKRKQLNLRPIDSLLKAHIVEFLEVVVFATLGTSTRLNYRKAKSLVILSLGLSREIDILKDLDFMHRKTKRIEYVAFSFFSGLYPLVKEGIERYSKNNAK